MAMIMFDTVYIMYIDILIHITCIYIYILHIYTHTFPIIYNALCYCIYNVIICICHVVYYSKRCLLRITYILCITCVV